LDRKLAQEYLDVFPLDLIKTQPPEPSLGLLKAASVLPHRRVGPGALRELAKELFAKLTEVQPDAAGILVSSIEELFEDEGFTFFGFALADGTQG
jgi:hypothetical protein